MNKSKEIFILVLSVGFAAMLGLFASSLIFKKGGSTRVEVVQPIVADFDFADKPYFYEGALNPTLDIVIQQNNNDSILGDL